MKYRLHFYSFSFFTCIIYHHNLRVYGKSYRLRL
nr:MAG TPA: hypothetical protein [Caudoviricetes sp.]